MRTGTLHLYELTETQTPEYVNPMIATKFTVTEIFQKQRRLLVPMFQREYVWHQEAHWEPLWEDITAKATEWLSMSDSNQTLQRTHFLGAVVLDLVTTFGRDLEARSVIDGQQRLTTLQVILIAFRDYANHASEERLARKLADLTENDTEIPDQVYKIWPTNADRVSFTHVYSAESSVALEEIYPYVLKRGRKYPVPRPRLVEAYLYFYGAIASFANPLSEEEETEQDYSLQPQASVSARLSALYEAFSRYLIIIQLELEPQDDAQVIFETLNARGEPLRPSDLIRNFIFMEASRRHENVERLFDLYWREFSDPTGNINAFWNEETKQGRLRRPRIDIFVFHYLTFVTDQDIPITHLFQSFRAWWKKNDRSVEGELGSLKYYASIFRKCVDASTEGRLGVFAKRLKVIDTSTVYPLLLFLIGERIDTISATDLDGILTDLESYLVRRMVCNLGTKNYNRFFLSVLRSMKASEIVTRQSVQEQLLASSGDASRWPTDEEFHQAWIEYPSYSWLKGRTAIILEAIDLFQETEKQEKTTIVESLSVEHVLPQHWHGSDWPFPSEVEGTLVTSEQLVERRRRLLHTFGNLTLLTKPLNSAISNGPYSLKRPEIAKQSKLRLNTYFQFPGAPLEWSEESIIGRGEALFNTALKVWPRPASSR